MGTLGDIVFALCALVCVTAAIGVVIQKNPVYSVVCLLPFFLGMTALLVLLQNTFLAAVLMIVYGGAILVLFLFVLMLINLSPEQLRADYSPWTYGLSALGVGMLAGAIAVFSRLGTNGDLGRPFAAVPLEGTFGSLNSLSRPLFQQFVVPFELISVLIVVAIVGAVLLTKKRI
jgi:NADH-quinone oxidoreductase subunit J